MWAWCHYCHLQRGLGWSRTCRRGQNQSHWRALGTDWSKAEGHCVVPYPALVETNVSGKQIATPMFWGKTSGRTAAEGTRTAGRRRGGVLRKAHRRGSQDTVYGPEGKEHAGLETQRTDESKIHHSGSQDTWNGPARNEHAGLGTLCCPLLYAASGTTAGVNSVCC